jgi:hypothetical protein
MSGAERRRHPRVEVNVVVHVTAGDDVAGGRMHDISVDAVLLEAPRSWPVGTTVGLGFTLPGMQAPVSLSGTVIRETAEADGGARLMAVLFTDLPPATATAIDLFMAGQGNQG